MSRIIKKYRNRKLYDVTTSRFINLAAIAQMIKEGKEITVIDNATSEDITESILVSILLDEVKKKKGLKVLPTLLQQLIKAGQDVVADLIKKPVFLNTKSPLLAKIPMFLTTRQLKMTSPSKMDYDLKKLWTGITRNQWQALDKMIKREVNEQLKARGLGNRTNLFRLVKSIVESVFRKLDAAKVREISELKATVENLKAHLQKIGKRQG
uniref:PHA accumulation regulator DNA-binding N-terminal domain-containing protein n=1 Tax=candidate division WOR-3 bacterium TaxID=2052148 RepID=A0A7C6EGN2_UNCW3